MLDQHPNLVDYVKQGNVILFLGAGASLSASDKDGNQPPLAKRLGQLLSEKFLAGEMSDSSLSEIAECSISSTNTTTVQDYVREAFEDFEPGQGHRLLTKFSWAGIATTNYDLLVEKSYSDSSVANQTIRPIAHDGQVSRIVESENDLPYLKLHGCFNHMGPQGIRLVLSLDQYLDYEKERVSLFDTFEEWAQKYTFVFVGYGAQDLNIRKYITRLVDNVEDRMRFYFVKPNWADAERQMWETRKVTAIEADFDGFMEALDLKIGDEFRGMRVEVKMPPTLRNHLSSEHHSLSKNASLFFQNDALFIESAEMTEGNSSKKFYNGDSSGWDLILNEWDAVRDVVEDIVIEVILDEGETKEKDCELVLLRGYAGAGKTIALKRLSWELVSRHDGIGIFLDRPDNLNSAAISELAELTKKRIYVFIDDIGTGMGHYATA